MWWLWVPGYYYLFGGTDSEDYGTGSIGSALAQAAGENMTPEQKEEVEKEEAKQKRKESFKRGFNMILTIVVIIVVIYILYRLYLRFGK